MPLNRVWFWLGAALLLPLFIFGQSHGLWRHSEMRVVEIAREMYVSKNWAVPTLNGEVFLEKPPLMFASAALSFKLFGKVSEGIARVPSTIYAVLGALSVMLLGRHIGCYRMGLWAGLILTSGTLYFLRAHQCSIDIALTAFVSLTMLSFCFIYEKDKKSYSFLQTLPLYIFATLAFYAKAFIGILLPGAAILTFLLWMRDAKAIWRLKPWFGIIIFLALTGPWFLELWRQGNSEYLRIVFIDNHLYRFVETSRSELGHHTRWYWYLEIIWKFFKPWSLFIVPAGVLFFRNKFRRNFSGVGRTLILSWFISGLVLLTVSSTKREVYLLPLLPAASLAVAAWIEYRASMDPGPVWEQIFSLVFAMLLIGLSLFLPIYCAIQKEAGSPWALSFLPLSLLVSVPAFYFLVKKNWARFYALAMATAWVLALAAAIFYLPIYSLDVDASPFCRRIAEITHESKFIYAVNPQEKDYGYIGFYTGKSLRDLKNEQDIKELARSPSPVFVVMVAHNRWDMESEPEYVKKKGARLELIDSEPVGGRISAIWRLLPARHEKEAHL